MVEKTAGSYAAKSQTHWALGIGLFAYVGQHSQRRVNTKHRLESASASRVHLVACVAANMQSNLDCCDGNF
jgi:hypothetical protein